MRLINHAKEDEQQGIYHETVEKVRDDTRRNGYECRRIRKCGY